MIADLTNRWNSLPPRSRMLVAGGAVAIGAVLLVSAAWLPLERDLARLRQEVPRAAEQLNWMRAQAPMAKTMRARMTSSSGAPVVPSIEQSATAQGVRSYITKIEAEGNASARVTLEAAPFNSLILWISELQSTQGLIVDDATIEAHATPGLVNARLRLRSGA